MWLPAAGGEVFVSAGVWSGLMTEFGARLIRLSVLNIVVMVATVPCFLLQKAHADAFDGYRLVEQFNLPTSGGLLDTLADGRLVTIIEDEVYVENAAGSRTFDRHGNLPSADIPSFGAAFVRVSPDGRRIAVGNNGGSTFSNHQIGVFDMASLTGNWFAAPHFDAEWISDRYLAVTAPVKGGTSIVTALDTESADPTDPTNPIIIENIGGASGGIAFDRMGNLYTGNGYASPERSGTGATKAFGYAMWVAPLSGGPIPDFETDGTLVVDILSASPLVLDRQGNLIVGGGDFYGSGEGDFVAVVHSLTLTEALAGMGPADSQDPTEVRRLDPDTASDTNFYSSYYNNVRGELYIKDYVNPTVYVYAEVETSPFGTVVIDYQPAPGQFVNNATFNDPTQALGPPAGVGTSAANNESVVTLGGFGGSITLAFGHTVMDDPLNPFGMDATVFGNAFWVGGDPNAHWAECGVIEICRDVNGNGQPDDDEPWYLVPGTHIDDPVNQWDQQIWDDDVADDTYPPAFSSWIPPDRSGIWTTETFGLPDDVFGEPSVIRNPSDNQSIEGIFGYAEYSPTLVLGDLTGDNIVDDPDVTAEEFYTVPDDPRLTGVTEGSGGGDAFDIAWAVDPQTNELAHLDGFDFIRVTTAVNAVDQGHIVNEKSVEIDAVADVAPDPFGDYDGDGDIDLYDASGIQLCFGAQDTTWTACLRVDRQADGWIEDADVAAFVKRITGPY